MQSGSVVLVWFEDSNRLPCNQSYRYSYKHPNTHNDGLLELSHNDGLMEQLWWRVGQDNRQSLMHSVARILSKDLGLIGWLLTCLAWFHDVKVLSLREETYMIVQGAINHFHKSNTPMPFLKLNIAKAFDKVR